MGNKKNHHSTKPLKRSKAAKSRNNFLKGTTELKMPLKSAHKYVCPKCFKTYTYSVNMDRHVEKCRGNRCSNCGNIFLNNSNLTKHEKRCTRNLPKDDTSEDIIPNAVLDEKSITFEDQMVEKYNNRQLSTSTEVENEMNAVKKVEFSNKNDELLWKMEEAITFENASIISRKSNSVSDDENICNNDSKRCVCSEIAKSGIQCSKCKTIYHLNCLQHVEMCCDVPLFVSLLKLKEQSTDDDDAAPIKDLTPTPASTENENQLDENINSTEAILSPEIELIYQAKLLSEVQSKNVLLVENNNLLKDKIALLEEKVIRLEEQLNKVTNVNNITDVILIA